MDLAVLVAVVGPVDVIQACAGAALVDATIEGFIGPKPTAFKS